MLHTINSQTSPRVGILIIALMVALSPPSTRILHAEIIIDFEELSFFSGTSGNSDGEPGGSYYNGDNGTGEANSNGWTTRGATFANTYSPDFGGYWSGWAYSNVVNRLTPFVDNQYASFPGGGSDGSGGIDVGGNYAVAYTGSELGMSDAMVRFGQAMRVHSIDIANTTWVALYARDNNPPFYPNRDNFTDGDFLRLKIQGLDGNDSVVGEMVTSLVDFGGVGTSDNFILDDWLSINLDSLGTVSGLRFVIDSNLTSTYFGVTYIDPPAYVAIDNLRLTAIPEPSSLLGCGGLFVLFGWYRSRRRDKQQTTGRASPKRGLTLWRQVAFVGFWSLPERVRPPFSERL